MALPTNADVVVVQGYWWDEITQQGVANASVSFKPVPLGSAVSATKTPNLRDLGASGYVKTRARVASVDPDTGYFATLMVASNDPDLDAYGGREVVFTSGSTAEPPFVVEVPYNASTTTVDAEMADATGLDQGATVRVVWLADAALLTTPTPAPSVNYLTSTQTLSAVTNGIEAHEEDEGAHPEMQAALLAGVSETARDALGAALAAGANITITPDDGADTITIAASVPAGYTDEQAQDTFAALIAAGTHSGISFFYNDASNSLSATVTAQSWSQITGKPTFAAVATSGSASDITTGTLPDGVIPSGIARDSEVSTAVANLVDSAPGTLDTLGEIAAQLASDESAAAALATTVGQKAAKSANLSDLASAATARTNLGLAAVAASGSASDITTGTLPDGVIPSGVARDSEVTTAVAAKQDIDSDLTAIAGLAPSNDDLLQRKSGAWTNRTPAQVRGDLGVPTIAYTDGAAARALGWTIASDYGVLGTDTVDTTAIQAALTAAGTGVCWFGPGTFRYGAPLTFTCSIQGAGPRTVFKQDFTGSVTPGLSAAGSYGSPATVTINISDDTGAAGVAVPTTGLAINDWVQITSDALYAEASKGELGRIKSIDGPAGFTLWGLTRDRYQTSDNAKVRRVAMLSGLVVRDLTITNANPEAVASSGSPLLNFTACDQVLVENVILTKSDSAGVRLTDCVNATVRGCQFDDFADSNTNNWFGYGVDLRGTTEGALIDGCRFRRVRHAVTTTSAAGVVRSCLITNCVAEDTTAPAFDSHSNAASITYTGNSVTGVRNGFYAFQVRGQDIRIIGNSVQWCSGGVNLNTAAHGCEVRGNVFRHLPFSNGAGVGVLVATVVGGAIVDNTISATGNESIYISGNPSRFFIVNNRLDLPGQYAAAPFVRFAGSSGADNRVERNVCSNFATSTGERLIAGSVSYGIVLAAGYTGTMLAYNSFTGCTNGWVSDAATGTIKIGNRQLDTPRLADNRAALVVAAQGYVAETPAPLGAVGNTSGLTSGRVNATAVGLFAGETITNISVIMTANGATLTLAKVALLDKNGNRLAVSADAASSFTSGAAKLVTVALTAPYTVQTDDLYYASLLVTGTTMPTLGRMNGTFDPPKLGTNPSFGALQNSQTDIGATVTLSPGGPVMWFGLS